MSTCLGTASHNVYLPENSRKLKSNQNFRDITWNVVENMILYEIFCVVFRFPRYISSYIADSGTVQDFCLNLAKNFERLIVSSYTFISFN